MQSTPTIAAANEESHEAWNGVLFDRFGQFRDVIVGSLGAHGAEALRLNPPPRGARALDIGCGYGDTSQQIAALVGPEGSVLGLDVAERFIETAKEEAAEYSRPRAGSRSTSSRAAATSCCSRSPVR